MASIATDFILFVVTAALFTIHKKVEAASPSDRTCPAESLRNSAFVFIKPHANTPETQKLVREKLTKAGIAILSEKDIEGKTIDEEKLIDQHYYAIASKATILPAEDIPVPKDMFKEKFGESWDTVLKENRACNAMEACKRFNCNAAELDAAWQKAKTVVKFGGGFYCGLVSMKGKDDSIHAYDVEWSPKDLSWESFRNEVLGPTDPAEAPPGSLRKTILDNYQELGLKSKPNKGDNGVHASASPFEGLAEKINWLGRSVDKDAFGKALMDKGLSKKTIEEWSVDPRINMPGGTKGSVFDALEDMDVEECLAKMMDLNELNADVI